ncbi:hypothetical protein DFQ30_000555 [Apophysomyces sp. BC1015]|nr:hypothetical protein DFQ30_000555 [Apophysomyces sp. BC1015]
MGAFRALRFVRSGERAAREAGGGRWQEAGAARCDAQSGQAAGSRGVSHAAHGARWLGRADQAVGQSRSYAVPECGVRRTRADAAGADRRPHGTDRAFAFLQARREPLSRRPVPFLSFMFGLRARGNPVSWRRARNLSGSEATLPLPSVFGGRRRPGATGRYRPALAA